MKVEELIELLKTMHPKARVVVPAFVHSYMVANCVDSTNCTIRRHVPQLRPIIDCSLISRRVMRKVRWRLRAPRSMRANSPPRVMHSSPFFPRRRSASAC